MLKEKLKKYHFILASGSPRRQQFFKDLDLEFEIRLKPVVEVYPKGLSHFEISNYLAELKSIPFSEELQDQDILITSDTIVWHNNKALGKPQDNEDAFSMLKALSGQTHEVITSVCIKTTTKLETVYAITKVTFKALSEDEIWYYINTYAPHDKAGAYGIQEWIGKVGVTHIEGSHFNVMGLPTHLLYQALLDIIDL